MAVKSHTCMLGLIILCSLYTGMTRDTDVFGSSGKDVSLPCHNALSDCTSTTWIYNKNIRSRTIELFATGQKKNDIKRRERLSLGSDCSLNIYKTITEDYGFYTCRQYVNGQEHGTDASVFLHVLHVLVLSSSTHEMRSGSTVALSCRLLSYNNSCDTLIRTEGIQLDWQIHGGVIRQTDSRFQISLLGRCISNLITTLLNEDHNTEWRCLLKKKNEIETSAGYKVKVTDDTHLPVTTSNPETTSTTNASETEDMIIMIVEITTLAVPTVILLQIFCAGRAENRRTQTTQNTQ